MKITQTHHRKIQPKYTVQEKVKEFSRQIGITKNVLVVRRTFIQASRIRSASRRRATGSWLRASRMSLLTRNVHARTSFSDRNTQVDEIWTSQEFLRTYSQFVSMPVLVVPWMKSFTCKIAVTVMQSLPNNIHYVCNGVFQVLDTIHTNHHEYNQSIISAESWNPSDSF